MTAHKGTYFEPKQVMEDIGLLNDGFVASMMAQDVYNEPAVSLGELISQFPDVKRRTLLGAFAAENSMQSYIYGLSKLWLKESVIGTF